VCATCGKDFADSSTRHARIHTARSDSPKCYGEKLYVCFTRQRLFTRQQLDEACPNSHGRWQGFCRSQARHARTHTVGGKVLP
jgi:hypothetical protein